ncbi:hypothetical protein CCR85_03450, partial [Rhodothalassium salexigens]|uniref:calcium-binding protein n=1 Tax=Rhodothalassium salexigens TaxID=1086 RepID=UPI0023EEA5C9
AASGPVTVRLWRGTGQGNDAEGDKLVGIENVIGSGFDDVLVGASGFGIADNQLEGQDGDDLLRGAGGNDRLLGGNGDDTLDGGADADALFGGDGTDTADYRTASGPVTVRLWRGTGQGNDAEGDKLVGIENVIGSGFDDVLVGASGFGIADNQLEGQDGDDLLRGAGGNDRLLGGNGDDTLDGGADADALFGGDGNDTADYRAASGPVTVRLWRGTGQGNDAEGDNLVGIENVIGSGFDDVLVGASGFGIADNQLEGRAGDDILRGAGGNDRLFGGNGDDILDAGLGSDWLEGGAGADTFVIVAGSGGDTIVDFEPGRDLLDLSRIGGLQDLDDVGVAALDGETAGLAITAGDVTVTLLGLAPDDLDAADILF